MEAIKGLKDKFGGSILFGRREGGEPAVFCHQEPLLFQKDAEDEIGCKKCQLLQKMQQFRVKGAERLVGYRE